MEELENNTLMAHMRHHIDNDLRSIFIKNINHSIASILGLLKLPEFLFSYN